MAKRKGKRGGKGKGAKKKKGTVKPESHYLKTKFETKVLHLDQIHENFKPEQNDFLSILDQQQFSDVALKMENGKFIYCHQVILAARSAYFENIFSGP